MDTDKHRLESANAASKKKTGDFDKLNHHTQYNPISELRTSNSELIT